MRVYRQLEGISFHFLFLYRLPARFRLTSGSTVAPTDAGTTNLLLDELLTKLTMCWSWGSAQKLRYSAVDPIEGCSISSSLLISAIKPGQVTSNTRTPPCGNGLTTGYLETFHHAVSTGGSHKASSWNENTQADINPTCR